MSTDIRVGDLIRATRKEDPEVTASGRVSSVNSLSAMTEQFYLEFSRWDLEVLDRPVPKVEDDLLDKVIATYRKVAGWGDESISDGLREIYTRNFTPVINAVREYDRSKESK